jgi:hypothetical protein
MHRLLVITNTGIYLIKKEMTPLYSSLIFELVLVERPIWVKLFYESVLPLGKKMVL